MSSNNQSKLPPGLWPVMLTPFSQNGSINFETLKILTEFYINAGAAGLFVNCLSGEMYDLTPEERLRLTQSVVEVSAGRIPVVSTGTFGGSIEEQVEYINSMSLTGADAVIIITSIISPQGEDDGLLLERLKHLSSKTEGISLGVYECPIPYKRLVTPEIMKWLAESGRFVYHKDTSCDLNNIKAKLNVINNSSILGFYNANTTTGLDSIRLGADGLSPISANFFPELYSYLLKNLGDERKSSEIEYLQRMLILMDAVIHQDVYPLAAKIFLNQRGMPIETIVRVESPQINYEMLEYLKILQELFDEISKNLKIDVIEF